MALYRTRPSLSLSIVSSRELGRAFGAEAADAARQLNAQGALAPAVEERAPQLVERGLTEGHEGCANGPASFPIGEPGESELGIKSSARCAAAAPRQPFDPLSRLVHALFQDAQEREQALVPRRIRDREQEPEARFLRQLRRRAP